MKVLVTGAAGYIGSALVPELLRAGHTVTDVDNFMYGQTSLLDVATDKRLEIVRCDVREFDVMQQLVVKADAIIPLAAIVGAPSCDRSQWDAIGVNQAAIIKMLQYRSRDQLIISPCTNSGYGASEDVCTEDTPLKPLSLYATTKIEAEKAILDAGNSISLRLATVFGVSPRMRLDLLVNDLVYRAVTEKSVVIFEGHFMRNYVGLPDVCRAFLAVLDNQLHTVSVRPGRRTHIPDGAYNVGLDAANMTKLELCATIARHVPFTYVEAEIGADPDQRNYRVSSDKIRPWFEARYTLETGIAHLLKAFQVIRRTAFTNL